MMKKTAFGYGFGLSPVAFSTACSLRLLSSSAVSSSVSLNAVISSALSASSRGTGIVGGRGVSGQDRQSHTGDEGSAPDGVLTTSATAAAAPRKSAARAHSQLFNLSSFHWLPS
uniref:Putative secreted protein n=1 Tax=Ixodes ricinus TaxID=34613 RepID=A0A6B0UKH9_IXORI